MYKFQSAQGVIEMLPSVTITMLVPTENGCTLHIEGVGQVVTTNTVAQVQDIIKAYKLMHPTALKLSINFEQAQGGRCQPVVFEATARHLVKHNGTFRGDCSMPDVCCYMTCWSPEVEFVSRGDMLIFKSTLEVVINSALSEVLTTNSLCVSATEI